MASSCIPKWCDLPPEILGLLIARLPNPADSARLRAVCRSWHSAARPQLPWVVLGSGYVFSPSDGRSHRLPAFPDDGICVGSTGDWLALALGDVYYSDHAYMYRFRSFLLLNAFSGKSVPLTVLDGVVVHETCKIRKFLMRSSNPDDLIAVVTDNANYPLAVFREGRGAWLPERWERRYKYIIDVAFLGDRLYAITRAEDLIPFDLGLDENGTPVVTVGKRVIKQSPGIDDYNGWITSDDDADEEENGSDDNDDSDDDDDYGDKEENDNAKEEVEEDSHDEATTTTYEEDGDNDCDDEATTPNDDDDDEDDDEEDASEEGDGSHNLNYSIDFTSDDETGELIVTSRHLIESRGKLLLVRRQKQSPDSSPSFIRRVEVLEADLDTGRWVPLPVDKGLGGDRAVFISTSFSKFVSAPCGDVEADVVYDINTGEAFDFRSQTSRPSRFCKPSQGITWLFHPELVL